MTEKDVRTAAVIGEGGVDKLAGCHVAVFGCGGVGGYAIEALVRSGVGAITLVDADAVSESNINRQIIATYATVGRRKVDLFRERIAEINPACKVTALDVFFDESSSESFDFGEYDYVVDAIDTVASKVLLAVLCERAGTPLIASMGTGGKLSPMNLKVADIYKTSVCPLARAMRTQLKKAGVKRLKTVYSDELPIASKYDTGAMINLIGHRAPGSAVFVVASAGILIASEVVKDLIGE